MDPLYYQVNQSRLTENTRRSSDNLRMQQSKETKERARRAGEIDKSDDSTNVGSMSDDLMGSMDPDEHFGKGAEAYQRAWEEELEREERKEESEGEGDGEGSGQQQGEGQDPQEQHQPSDSSPPPAESPEDRPPALEAKPLERPLDSAPAGVAEKPPEPTSPAPSSEKPAEAPAPPPSSKLEPKGAPRAETVQLSPEAQKVKPAPPAPSSSPDKVERSAPVQIPTGNSGGSLLWDMSAGFLIAEEFQVDETPVEGQAAATEEAEPEPQVEPAVAELLERLIVGDSSTPGYRRLQTMLSRFGSGVLRLCLDQGSKVYLLPRGERLDSHPLVASLLNGEARDAAYLTSARACVFQEDCLIQAPRYFHPVLFYFAYAFDHALGGEDFASIKSPAVQASFQACQDGPHRFSDPLAGLHPVHYFAQAVESYLSENDCHEPLWTRQDLFDFDRSMYEYVDYLFRRQNKR